MALLRVLALVPVLGAAPPRHLEAEASAGTLLADLVALLRGPFGILELSSRRGTLARPFYIYSILFPSFTAAIS